MLSLFALLFSSSSTFSQDCYNGQCDRPVVNTMQAVVVKSVDVVKQVPQALVRVAQVPQNMIMSYKGQTSYCNCGCNSTKSYRLFRLGNRR